MAGKSPPLYAWDTCTLLAWIKNESRPADQMRGLADVAKHIQQGEANLLTSVIARAEIFLSDLTEEQRKRYRDLFMRPACVEVGVTARIADRASKIRLDSKTPNGSYITTPDAIHLA